MTMSLPLTPYRASLCFIVLLLTWLVRCYDLVSAGCYLDTVRATHAIRMQYSHLEQSLLQNLRVSDPNC